jgi:hypothetical protein
VSSDETICPDYRIKGELMKHASLTESIFDPHLANHALRSRNERAVSRQGKRSPAISKKLERLDKVFVGLLGTGKGPRVVFVYQDDESRTWAKIACERMEGLAGDEGLRATWWKISDLTAPGILAGAVSSAMRADLIVVASHAGGLPLPFYVWINLWWPNRGEHSGALVALIGAQKREASHSGRVGEYLRIVAEQARMEFFSIENSSTSSAEKLQPMANASTQFRSWNGHLHD